MFRQMLEELNVDRSSKSNTSSRYFSYNCSSIIRVCRSYIAIFTLLLVESYANRISLVQSELNTVGEPKLILVPLTVPTTAVPCELLWILDPNNVPTTLLLRLLPAVKPD